MNRKNLWAIPMIMGGLFFLIVGGLGFIMWQISRSPGVYWVMDPTYPFYLIVGPLVSYMSYKRLRSSDVTEDTE